MNTEGLLHDRGTTHGDFSQNAIYGQELRSVFRSSPQWLQMPPVQREALDLIACKLSRILSGQSRFDDHWKDVIGYATLALDGCESRQVKPHTADPDDH